MKPPDLHLLWSAPDNSRLTAKQYSFRLPVHVAAQLAALGELFPTKTKTDLVGDLLTAALKEVEANLPVGDGDSFEMPDGTTVQEGQGLRRRFWDLANAHYQALERELGNESPKKLF
jgi:hypothetical protein